MILNGKSLALQLRKELKETTVDLEHKPGLAVILVGGDTASKIYVGSKKKVAAKLGWNSELVELPEDISKDRLDSVIEDLNQNPKVNGILLQLPLPKHLKAAHHLDRITPLKDVDGFHSSNVGRLCQGIPRFVPCTPLGVLNLLKHYDIPLKGSNAVVIGKSQIVGRPMAQLLMMEEASVSVLHSNTKDLKEYTKNADLIISATGVPGLIGAEHLGRDCFLVDVGIHRREDGSLCGDLRFDELQESPFCKAITPVPGGVGPMTIASLMQNTYKAFRMHISHVL